MKKEKKKKKIKLSIIGIVLTILLLLATISLIYMLKILNLIPEQYIKLIMISLIIILLITGIILIIKSDNKIFKILKTFIYIIVSILLIGYSIGIYYLNNTVNLFDNISVLKEEVTNYYIIVLDQSIYQETSDLYGETLGYYDNTEKEVIDSIKLDLKYTTYKDINELKEKFYNQELSSILISDIIKNKYEEDDENFENNIRVLETISIKKEIKDITKKVTMKNTPFNVLISGIDTYGEISTTSRNDVNIVATINPNTDEVLLTSIPRDYYVKLHGTDGPNDKLTHASYYGINMAVQTIEDILDIDINYYVKVNFTTVIDIVDALKGIDVYADEPINLYDCGQINVGYNHLNGECALAFSRERYQYSDGDLHRGRNQQEVINAMFKKISSGTTIITEYNDLLKAIDGEFATNADINDVTDYIKYELNDLSKYKITNTQLNGWGSMGETYSYPGQDLWIMIPNQETIDTAKYYINKVLNNEKIS